MKKLYSSAFLAMRIFSILLLAAVSFSSRATIQNVTVTNFSFTPSSFNINLGDTVKWIWNGGTHTTTSTTIPGGAAAWNHSIANSAGNTTFIYVPTVLGTYNYDCSIHYTTMLASFTVVCPAVTVSISPHSATTFCSGGSCQMLSTVSGGSGFTYQWKLGNSNISGATNSSYTTSAAGNYKLVATNSCGSNNTSNTITITVLVAPTSTTAAISAGSATTFCSGGSVTLTVAGAGFNYQWKLENNPISNATNQSYVASAAGHYTCAIDNQCGAITSNTIQVIVNTAPSAAQAAITANGPTTFCSGLSVTLNCATAGLTYQWTKSNVNINGATNQGYSVTVKGNYNCKATNSCGTTTSNSINVNVNKLPKAKITPAGTVSFCVGQSAVLTASTGNNYTYQWYLNNFSIGGATNSTLTVTAAGAYKVTVTISTSGCTKTSANKQVVTPCRLSVDESANISIYPNPSSSGFTINFGTDASTATDVQIFDLTGKLISSQKVIGSTMVVGNDLVPGVYFAKIISNGSVVQVLKMMKTE